jgi:hypothetical protein
VTRRDSAGCIAAMDSDGGDSREYRRVQGN